MVMKITNFGGLVPRAHRRALPDDGAQTAHNLLATTREFRPLATDVTVVSASGVSDPQTIFRLQRNADGSINTDFASAGNWKIAAGPRSYAKGQVNDDLTDRHYLTFDDGSAPPRWIDATGEDRRLGVPAPTDAPTVTVNTVDEFTTDDRGAALDAARQQVVGIIRAGASPVWRGAEHPGTGTDGYVDQLTTYGFPVQDESKMVRAWRLSGDGGTVTDTYSAAAIDEVSWIFDPLLGGVQGPAAASPAWAGGAGTWHYMIPFAAYGLTYDIDVESIGTQLAAIDMPGTDDGTKLFTTDQVDAVKSMLSDYADPAGARLKPKLDALANSVHALEALLDGGARGSLATTTQAFYSKTDVATEIAAALLNAGEDIWGMADGIARSAMAPQDFGGSGP